MIQIDFEAAYVAGSVKTIRFLVSKGCSLETAEDFSQQAWLKAWEKREQFRGDSNVVTWVGTIALNILRSEWRKPEREHVGEEVLFLRGRSTTAHSASDRSRSIARVCGLPHAARAGRSLLAGPAPAESDCLPRVAVSKATNSQAREPPLAKGGGVKLRLPSSPLRG